MTTDDLAQWLILERYRVLGELGRGGMGIVYKVHDDRLDRVIALKTIRKDRLVVEIEPEQEVLDDFRREAKAAGKLSHPGIVTIYDISEEGEDLYIATEFVAGEPLGARMRATPRMPVAEAARPSHRREPPPHRRRRSRQPTAKPARLSPIPSKPMRRSSPSSPRSPTTRAMPRPTSCWCRPGTRRSWCRWRP